MRCCAFVELPKCDLVPSTLYSWRRKDPLTGCRRVLAWKMTEEDAHRWAAREGAEIENVPNSEEIRTPVSGYGAVFFPAQSTNAIEQHFTDLGREAEGRTMNPCCGIPQRSTQVPKQ